MSVDCYASWVDLVLSPAAYTPDSTAFNVATATTTDLVAAPSGTTRRQIKHIAIRNRGTSANTVSVILDVSATDYRLTPDVVLQPGESLVYVDVVGWTVLDSTGREKSATSEYLPTGGRSYQVFKVGTAAEAPGQWMSMSKDTGSPGAWATGSPGVNGRATDGTSATDAGCVPVTTPASGTNYLTGFVAAGTTGHLFQLIDVLWVNSALVVTTTTAQAFTPPAWPARDDVGSANGAGVMVGIFVTATLGNGAVTTITMSYTNQSGTAGRSATMASLTATTLIGTIVWFQLQAGDYGVRTIASITLGTTLVSGSISIIAARMIASAPGQIANVGAKADLGRGVPLWAGSCLFLVYLASVTTATNAVATLAVESR